MPTEFPAFDDLGVRSRRSATSAEPPMWRLIWLERAPPKGFREPNLALTVHDREIGMGAVHMKLSAKIKTALDETRMLILGSQILLGFQFQSVFRDAFEDLPKSSHYLDGIALILMLITIAALIAPASYHRIAEGGTDTGRLHRYICRMTTFALLPFAISLGIDVFIAISWLGGFGSGLWAGASFAALALIAWYGVEYSRRKTVGTKERAMTWSQKNEVVKTPLHTKIEQMLTEARVILPGAQALLGFQLAIVITESFGKLPPTSKITHAVALGLVALSIILLMAPAAYHRIVYAGEDTPEFHTTGSVMVTVATIPLALGISADVYVVLMKISNTPDVAIPVAVCAVIGFVAVWHIFPFLKRRANLTGQSEDPGSSEESA